MTKEKRVEYIVLDAEEKKAFKYLFKGRRGKQVLSYLEKNCFANETTYVKGDPHGTSFHEGMRQTLLNIKQLIALDPLEIDSLCEKKIKSIKQESV